MKSKVVTVIGMGICLLLFGLYFIPSGAILKIDSDSVISSPLMVLGNADGVPSGFTIVPINCSVVSAGFHESNFQVTNTHENDYGLKIRVSFTDDHSVLYEKEIDVVLLSGQTTNQAHRSDNVYENPICVVQIIDWYEL